MLSFSPLDFFSNFILITFNSLSNCAAGVVVVVVVVVVPRAAGRGRRRTTDGACLLPELKVKVGGGGGGLVSGVERPSRDQTEVRRGFGHDSMEFISDLVAVVDEAAYPGFGGLSRVLQTFSPERRGSCYRLRGTYQQLEELSFTLLALSQASAPSPSRRRHGASAHTEPVEVSTRVMTYIREKCKDKLDKILGQNYDIVAGSESRKVSHNQTSTVVVAVRPHHVPSQHIPVDFVKQRFITFYQRTASDLQVASVHGMSCDHKDLQKRFPNILFFPSHNKPELMAVGPFVDVAKLKAFLSPKAAGLYQSQGDQRAAAPLKAPSSSRRTEPEDDLCLICMETILGTNKTTLACSHSFCRDCLKTAFKYKPVCPTCGQVFGPLRGIQPRGGEMSVSRSSSSLPGHESFGTIVIKYYIPSGIQKEEHPNPGQPYDGASRSAFLPDSPEGRDVLELLRRAFEQRLIFTVGQSTTTGRKNTVTWNDIHHKTSTHGGPTHYGYPDPDYLRRVRDELKVKGIE